MKTYTLAECREFLQEQDYKHVALQTSDGRDVVKYNTAKMKPEERMNQMETRLKAPTLPDGYYIFLGKYNMQRDSVPDKYYIVKGDPNKLDKEPMMIPENSKQEANALSFDQAIKMNKKIAELEANSGLLERERDEYREKYYDLLAEVWEIIEEEPEEEEEEESPLSEGFTMDHLGKFIENATASLIPIFDRHYDLKQKELEIKEGQTISNLMKQGFVPPVQNNGNTEHAARQVNNEIEVPDLTDAELAQMTPEEQVQYRHLQLAQLSQTDPEKYRQVVAQMNSGQYQADEPEEGLEP